jgi:hypothetical protein
MEQNKMSEDKLTTPCSICGKPWNNHHDFEYIKHAEMEMERGDI